DGIECHLDLNPVPLSFLQNLPRCIFTYELLACGVVLDGPAYVLDHVPVFPARSIPKEDAWRIVANRMMELVGGFAPDAAETKGPDLHYFATKLWLAMAISVLLFLGAYEPTYSRRRQAIQRIAKSPLAKQVPLDWDVFARRIREATESKIGTEIPLEALG